jgi:hypothetical protein
MISSSDRKKSNHSKGITSSPDDSHQMNSQGQTEEEKEEKDINIDPCTVQHGGR